MLQVNLSVSEPAVFILEGLPRFESAHVWISFPVFVMYLVEIFGNGLMMILIVVEEHLHSPMYYFLCSLSLTDLFLSSSIVLNMLGIFWMSHKEITFLSCLVQMFSIHFFAMIESGILVAMALDRYVAICMPLHYTTVLTTKLIVKIDVGLIIRGILLVTPFPLMANGLPYCQNRHIAHSYCDHMAVVKLACTDVTVNSAYGLTVALFVIIGDTSAIAMSYSWILRAVLRLSSNNARNKAFSTCTSHICILLLFYTLGLFSFLAHRVGHIAPYIHVIFANLYMLIPSTLNPIIYGAKTKDIRTALYNRFLKLVNL
ncbi:olfactory receptor 52N2-like [Gastrophryne carolinensis]